MIKGQAYNYIDHVMEDQFTRDRYFQLSKEIYKLKYEKWYQSGYMDNHYIPYIIMHRDMAVSSVAVCVNDISWQGQQKRYVQISTVMTLPEYRNKGLNRYLLENVLTHWVDKCDAVYLLSNDSVVDFYPKFDFEEYKEFQYSKPVLKVPGTFRKLDIEDPEDWNLIIRSYIRGNPFSELKVDNLGQFIFHCIQFRTSDIYYMEQYDAVAVVKYENKTLICYDVFAGADTQLDDILGIMANGNTDHVYLGFTPNLKSGYTIEESQEEDNHLFVLKEKENIFKDNKVMFPMLSRA
jgi:GNAT superfamily N-acetyltransferase